MTRPWLWRIHDEILGAGDALVLWAWDTFEIPRAAIIRAQLVVWCVYGVAVDVARGRVDANTWVTAGVALLMLAIEELQAAHLTPKIRNALFVSARTMLATRTVHFAMVAACTVSIVVSTLLRRPLQVVNWAQALAFAVTCWALIPERPPRPRKVLRSSLVAAH